MGCHRSNIMNSGITHGLHLKKNFRAAHLKTSALVIPDLKVNQTPDMREKLAQMLNATEFCKA